MLAVGRRGIDTVAASATQWLTTPVTAAPAQTPQTTLTPVYAELLKPLRSGEPNTLYAQANLTCSRQLWAPAQSRADRLRDRPGPGPSRVLAT